MGWPEWLSIVALIMSAISIIWHCFAWWHSQPRIEIKVLRTIDPSYPTDKPKFTILLINHGDKDITLNRIGLKDKSNKGDWVFVAKTIKLAERSNYRFYLEEESLKDALYPYVATAGDATGKKYKSKPTKLAAV
jgi:hypothetical protein